MRMVTRVLIAAALTFGSGCVQADWIDRTLVTVDVTGTWYGSPVGTVHFSPGEFLLELEQQGSTVKGFLRSGTSGGSTGSLQGPIDGTVAGDVFRFQNTRGTVKGELMVSGDDMTGLVLVNGPLPISLRRVDPSSRPGPPGQ